MSDKQEGDCPIQVRETEEPAPAEVTGKISELSDSIEVWPGHG